MNVLSAFLLLGIASIAFCEEECPPKNEVKPCVCHPLYPENIRVRCFSSLGNKITLDGLKQAFKSLQGKAVEEMLVFDNSLGTVPPDLFKGIRIKALFLDYNHFSSLSDGEELIFAGLEDSLEELRITDSLPVDSDLSKIRFGHLKKLEQLLIYKNKIKEVRNSWFENGPASLKTVDFPINEIEKIGDRAFANLPNLTRASFYANNLRSVERGMFPKPALHLKELHFPNNPLESLPEDIFSDMPGLREVTLEATGIAHLDEQTWKPVWEQLEKVNLEGTALDCHSLQWALDLKIPEKLYGKCYDREKNTSVYIRNFLKEKKGENDLN